MGPRTIKGHLALENSPARDRSAAGRRPDVIGRGPIAGAVMLPGGLRRQVANDLPGVLAGAVRPRPGR